MKVVRILRCLRLSEGLPQRAPRNLLFFQRRGAYKMVGISIAHSLEMCFSILKNTLVLYYVDYVNCVICLNDRRS